MIGPGALGGGMNNGKFRNIGPGGKSPRGGGTQDHNLHIIVGTGLAEQIDDALPDFGIQGVQLVGAVQHDFGDLAGFGHVNRIVTHGRPFQSAI